MPMRVVNRVRVTLRSIMGKPERHFVFHHGKTKSEITVAEPDENSWNAHKTILNVVQRHAVVVVIVTIEAE